MKKTVWHDASKERPPKSGYYLAITKTSRTANSMSYSAKYDAFNASDETDTKSALEVEFWAYAEDIMPKGTENEYFYVKKK